MSNTDKNEAREFSRTIANMLIDLAKKFPGVSITKLAETLSETLVDQGVKSIEDARAMVRLGMCQHAIDIGRADVAAKYMQHLEG